MDLKETGFEDGMVIQIWSCNDCDIKAKGWWDLDPNMANNISWTDEI